MCVYLWNKIAITRGNTAGHYILSIAGARRSSVDIAPNIIIYTTYIFDAIAKKR